MPPGALPVLLCVVLWTCVSVSADCPLGQAYHYNEKYDDLPEQWCCVVKNCPKGSVGQICRHGHPYDTSCVACRKGYFMPLRSKSNEVTSCLIKKACDEGREKTEGSTTENRECGKCNVSDGYYPQYTDHHGSSIEFICHRRKCPEGQQLNVDDRDKGNVKESCVSCPPGSFKDVKGFYPCKQWTHCEALGLVVEELGNVLKDTTCRLKNATTTPISETTTGLVPRTGESKENEKDGVLVIAIPVALVCVVILVIIIFLVVVRLRRERSPRLPFISGVEKEHLRRSNSSSDSEDSLPSKQNEKNLRKLMKVPNVPPLDIKKANSQSSETSALTHSIHTPDSGIAEIYAALTPTFRSGPNTPRPYVLAHDVVTDCVPEVEEECSGVNPSSPGRLGGSRSCSTNSGDPSPTDSSESGHSSAPSGHSAYLPNGYISRGRHQSGSSDLPEVHGNGGMHVNQYYINNLIYQKGQSCQVNNFGQPQTSVDEEDEIPPDQCGSECSYHCEPESPYNCDADGSIQV